MDRRRYAGGDGQAHLGSGLVRGRELPKDIGVCCFIRGSDLCSNHDSHYALGGVRKPGLTWISSRNSVLGG